jgi:triosephosphate isomerase
MYYVIANWKENLAADEVIDWLVEFKNRYTFSDKIRVGLAPSYTEIRLVRSFLENWNLIEQVDLLSQDVSRFSRGRYTGEVGAFQLAALGTQSCIIGHSERRSNFNETNEHIGDKIARTLESNLRAVVAFSQIEQVEHLATLNLPLEKISFAYEPIENIGTGNSADPTQVNDMLQKTQQILGKAPTTMIYGGSVDKKTVSKYFPLENVGGFLVGTASQKAESFVSLLEAIAQG